MFTAQISKHYHRNKNQLKYFVNFIRRIAIIILINISSPNKLLSKANTFIPSSIICAKFTAAFFVCINRQIFDFKMNYKFLIIVIVVETITIVLLLSALLWQMLSTNDLYAANIINNDNITTTTTTTECKYFENKCFLFFFQYLNKLKIYTQKNFRFDLATFAACT